MPLGRGIDRPAPSSIVGSSRSPTSTRRSRTTPEGRGEAKPRLPDALAAPMMREGQGVGALWVRARSPGPFPEKQVELLKTFADQAVIAIENARLFNETREALGRQTATAEVFRQSSSSPTTAAGVRRDRCTAASALFAAPTTSASAASRRRRCAVARVARPGDSAALPGSVSAAARPDHAIGTRDPRAHASVHVAGRRRAQDAPRRTRDGLAPLAAAIARSLMARR